MKKKEAIMIGAGVLGILATVVVGYIVLIVYVNWPNDRTIAKSVMVTREWTEIDIDPSVTPAKRAQYINLRINDFKVDRNSNSFDIKLPDGKIVAPEIELYDEFGQSFEFHHSGFAMKAYDDVTFTPGPSNQMVKLPADRKYTKLRIRSDIPFSCDQIYWRDYHPK
jgi:hypothetical protein